MNRLKSLDRQAVVTTLATIGLGLGLVIAATGGTPPVFAQDVSTPVLAQTEGETADDARQRVRSGELRQELYAEFTAALADELGIGNADEVDAAIRVAMMTVVDARVADGLLTTGQAEAVKVLIATSDVPLGPGPIFGPPHGPFFRGLPGTGEGRFFFIRGGDRDSTAQTDEGTRADDGEDPAAISDPAAANDAGSNEDEVGT